MSQPDILSEKSMAFAIRIVKMYQYLAKRKKEFILSGQVVRSGTSIGANIAESKYAISKKDFISKRSIALKEAAETEFWLALLNATGYLSDKQHTDIHADCQELLRLLISSTKTLKAQVTGNKE
jgi:four helix bundle protein